MHMSVIGHHSRERHRRTGLHRSRRRRASLTTKHERLAIHHIEGMQPLTQH